MILATRCLRLVVSASLLGIETMGVVAAAVEVVGFGVGADTGVVGMQMQKDRVDSARIHNFADMGCGDLLMEDRREA
jgi:hypothetical protein